VDAVRIINVYVVVEKEGLFVVMGL